MALPTVNLNDKARDLVQMEAGIVEMNIAQAKDLMNDFADLNSLEEWIAIWFKYKGRRK